MASREGARVAAVGSGGSAGSGAIVVAPSYTVEEAIARRPGTTVPAALRTMHRCPEKCNELLMHEATKMAGMKDAREGGSSIKGNQTSSHLTLLCCQ